MVKKRLPPFYGEDDRIRSWSLKEPTGGEERRTMEDAAPEDAATALRKSEPKLGSRTVEIRCRDEDRWPGEHASEPPRFRRSVANPGTGVQDRGERSGRWEVEGDG
ncbi:hypothetical protein NDU88_002611 [Pleurodeles waltl]|uniref:Uncharacterized protein n=1 Tax=Pleurodeles waltl TaxID=8319 RepID=A0AAV7NMG7_PLEWA|nr:hypothetical protein NDU88_002611 [Pleurodeles waltl]